ncbi:MAG: sugar nucleotide-binding protein [Phycisphaerales bacterium JB065]
MRTLITGSRGTVGSALRAVLESRGDEVIGWDRSVAPPHDVPACAAYLDAVKPEAVVHLAVASSGTGIENEGRIVSVDWSERLASYCAAARIPLVFTSTVMVFSDDATGPFTIESEPDATEGYGGEKAEAERKVLAANPEAVVARLGWQIGEAPGSNHMIDFLTNAMKKDGVVKASRKWKPATSFLADTAGALAWLRDEAAAGRFRGVAMVDGNRAGVSFYDLVRALSAKHGGAFTVEADDSFVYDQRMLDERVLVGQVGERLGL